MPITRYTTANGMLLGERTDSGPRIDYVPDALGSIVAAVDQNLNTAYTAAYTPYGAVLASTGTAPNFTWVGNVGYLASAGRPYAEYSVRARLLSSKNGRWTSVDRLWPTALAYAYVGCGPALHIDPTGRLAWPTNCCCTAVEPIEVQWWNASTMFYGQTIYIVTVNWSVNKPTAKQVPFSCAFEWWEKTNVPTPGSGTIANQWYNVNDYPIFQPGFPGCVGAQAGTCPRGGAGTCSDTDGPKYPCPPPTGLPDKKCLCIKIIATSGCDGSSFYKIFSQTVGCSWWGTSFVSPPSPEPSTTRDYCLDVPGATCV